MCDNQRSELVFRLGTLRTFVSYLLAGISFALPDVGHAPGVEHADSGRETIFLSPGIRYHVTDSLAVMHSCSLRSIGG